MELEKKFAVLRLTLNGLDKIVIVPVLLGEGKGLAAAKRDVLRQFDYDAQPAWIGWTDGYHIFNPIQLTQERRVENRS